MILLDLEDTHEDEIFEDASENGEAIYGSLFDFMPHSKCPPSKNKLQNSDHRFLKSLVRHFFFFLSFKFENRMSFQLSVGGNE